MKIAEIKITYKMKIPASKLPVIQESNEAVEYFRTIWEIDKIEHVESFFLMLLNRANKVIGWSKISEGGINGTVADPKVIFQIALKANATSIIVAHNHPSGNKEPSESDERLTKKIKNAGKFLDLNLLDHLILTSEDYYSFAEENINF